MTQLRASLDLAISHIGIESHAPSFSSLTSGMSDDERSAFESGWLASVGIRRAPGDAVMGSYVLLRHHNVYLADYHDAAEMRTVGVVVSTQQISWEPSTSVMVDWGDGEPVRCSQSELLHVRSFGD